MSGLVQKEDYGANRHDHTLDAALQMQQLYLRKAAMHDARYNNSCSALV